jgi:hypothetical protein
MSLGTTETRQVAALSNERLEIPAARMDWAPVDSRAANNVRRIGAYSMAYQFTSPKGMPEKAQPVLGRLLLYMENGKYDTDTRKAVQALIDIFNDGDLRNYTGAVNNLDSNYYWALVREAKARGLNVNVSSSDPNPTDPIYRAFANKALPPKTYTGYNKQYILSLLSANTKQLLGLDGNGNPLPAGTTPAQAQAAALATPTVAPGGTAAAAPPSKTGNILTDTVNQAQYGIQQATFSATGSKPSGVQAWIIVAAIGIVVGGGIYLIGQYLGRKNG